MGIGLVRTLGLVLVACVAIAGSAAAKDVVRYRSTISGPAGLPALCGTASAESTPQIRRDPRDPRRLVAVYLDHGGDAAVGARSKDGGRSWRRLAVPAASACNGGPASRQYLVNPYLAVGPGGIALFGNSYAGYDDGLFRYAVLSHRLPWGAGWEDPVRLDPGADGQDAAVAFGRRARADFVWTRMNQVPNPFTYAPAGDALMTATSKDGGRTFSDPAVIDQPPPGTLSDNPAIERLANGTRVVAVRRPTAADLAELIASDLAGGPIGVEFDVDVLRSTDGVSWQRQSAATRASLVALTDPETGYEYGAGLTDFTAGPGGRLAFVNAPLAEDTGTIELTISSDAGRSWSEPAPTIRTPAQPMLPAVAIGRGGVIGLLWTDFRRDRKGDDEWTTDVWFASSRDGGRSWRRTHVDGPMDLSNGFQEGVAYDGGALGVAQDLIALPRGFAAAYSVTPPISRGATDVRFARIAAKRPGR